MTEDSLKHVPVVIIPPEHIFPTDGDSSDTFGFTDLTAIYMREDYFTHSLATHEFLHLFLYMIGKYPMGDIFHSDELFMKCGWDYLSPAGGLIGVPPMRPTGSFGN